MSAFATSNYPIETPALGTGAAPVSDVNDRVKSWGRRGVFLGANFGFVFGAIFVAIPFTSDVLTFGTIGTLLVGTVECAFIAGAFAALGAALYGKGVGGGSTAQFEHILQAGRRSAVSFSVPPTDWPGRWAYPVQATRLPLLQFPGDSLGTTLSLLEARLGTIDAWENGNTGP